MVEPGRRGLTTSLKLKSAHKRIGLTASALLATFILYIFIKRVLEAEFKEFEPRLKGSVREK